MWYGQTPKPRLQAQLLPGKPRIIPAADEHAVMREQLDSLIEHGGSGGYLMCGCDDCQTYLRLREMLLARMRVTKLHDSQRSDSQAGGRQPHGG